MSTVASLTRGPSSGVTRSELFPIHPSPARVAASLCGNVAISVLGSCPPPGNAKMLDASGLEKVGNRRGGGIDLNCGLFQQIVVLRFRIYLKGGRVGNQDGKGHWILRAEGVQTRDVRNSPREDRQRKKQVGQRLKGSVAHILSSRHMTGACFTSSQLRAVDSRPVQSRITTRPSPLQGKIPKNPEAPEDASMEPIPMNIFLVAL